MWVFRVLLSAEAAFLLPREYITAYVILSNHAVILSLGTKWQFRRAIPNTFLQDRKNFSGSHVLNVLKSDSVLKAVENDKVMTGDASPKPLVIIN